MEGLMEAASFVAAKAVADDGKPVVCLYPAGGGFNALRAAEKYRLDDLLSEFLEDYDDAPVKDVFIENVILKAITVHFWEGNPKTGYPVEPRVDELCKRVGQRMRDLRKKRKAQDIARGEIPKPKTDSHKNNEKGYLMRVVQEQGVQIKSLQNQFEIMLERLKQTQELLIENNPAKRAKLHEMEEKAKQAKLEEQEKTGQLMMVYQPTPDASQQEKPEDEDGKPAAMEAAVAAAVAEAAVAGEKPSDETQAQSTQIQSEV